MTEEKKISPYEEFVINQRTYYNYLEKRDKALSEDDEKSLKGLAARGVQENDPDKEGTLDTIYNLRPYIEREKKGIFNFIESATIELLENRNKTLKNLEGIINDDSLDEKILISGIVYLNPNSAVKDDKYKKMTGSIETFKGLNQIAYRQKEGRSTEDDQKMILKMYEADCKKRYMNNEDKESKKEIANCNSLIYLASISSSFRTSVVFPRLFNETAEKFGKELKEYGGIRKYVLESLKDNEKGNEEYLKLISGIVKKSNPHERNNEPETYDVD